MGHYNYCLKRIYAVHTDSRLVSIKLTNDSCRRSGNDTVLQRKAAGYHGAGANGRMVAKSDAGEDNGIHSDSAFAPDSDWSTFIM